MFEKRNYIDDVIRELQEFKKRNGYVYRYVIDFKCVQSNPVDNFPNPYPEENNLRSFKMEILGEHESL